MTRPLRTTRLQLVLPDAGLAGAVVDFYSRNRAHLGPWEPLRSAEFYDEAYHADRLAASARDVEAGTLAGWWLCPADEPERVVGNMYFSQIVRGAFHNAMLGYALDEACTGCGLMAEALRAGLAEVFAPPLSLHRVQANVRPENRPSLALLERLGFRREGLAVDYLYIDGDWRDHVMTALLNPAAVRPL